MDTFQTFLNSLQKPDNAPLVEAIQKGYQTIFEGENPLTKQYGGLWYGGEGGFRDGNQYSIGVGRLAEACHCILGALYRVWSGTGNPENWKRDYKTYGGHTMTEIRRIDKTLKEYRKPIYNLILEGYNEASVTFDREQGIQEVKNMKTAAPKLIDLATSKLNDLNEYRKELPEEIFRIAEQCYICLIVLGEELLNSLNYEPLPEGEKVYDYDSARDLITYHGNYKNVFENKRLLDALYTLIGRVHGLNRKIFNL